MKNNHIIPKADPYCGNRFFVSILQLSSFIFGTALGFGIGFLIAVSAGKALGWVFVPVVVLWVTLTEGLSIGLTAIVTLISKKICRKMTGEEKQLVKRSATVERHTVSPEMMEYLQKRKKFPWISVVVFVILLIMMLVCRIPLTLMMELMFLTVILCLVIGMVQSRNTMSCVSPDTEYHVADVHHTFSKFRRNYAVVYLPFGRFVYRVKSLDIEHLVFLSYKSQARLICDEEFFELVQNH